MLATRCCGMATAAAMEEPTLTATVNFFSVGEEESESERSEEGADASKMASAKEAHRSSACTIQL